MHTINTFQIYPNFATTYYFYNILFTNIEDMNISKFLHSNFEDKSLVRYSLFKTINRILSLSILVNPFPKPDTKIYKNNNAISAKE